MLDTEIPQLTCPADTTIQLAGGECDVIYIPTDWFTDDNCGVVDTITDPDWNLPLPIGINPVNLTVVDSSGNDTTCTYIVTVLENVPNPPQMACIGQLNIHLNNCAQEIVPEMLLTGDDYYCFDNYIVTLFQENADGELDTLPSTVVVIDQIGDTLIYQVYDPRNDILCWGYLEVGFFEAPEFICPADTAVSCNAFTDTTRLGMPILTSCALSGATVEFADTLQRFEECDDPRAILERTWTVTDNYGNSARCLQTITIEAFDIVEIQFPANLDGIDLPVISCAAAANDPTLTDPINTGFPFVEDGRNIFQTNFCSASFSYDDRLFDICAGSYEILRTWYVRNTCQPVIEGVNPRTFTQIIRVRDSDNPQLVCPAAETISTGPFDCNGAYVIPEPEVVDNCSGYSYEVSVTGGTLTQLTDGTYVLADLAEGVYGVQYEVEDECGRYSECQYFITVTDLIDANAICEDSLNVSLDNNGYAQLDADDIDGGSSDLCGSVDLSIRRDQLIDPDNCEILSGVGELEWLDHVELTCCDLNSYVKVHLRVIDQDGNESACWTDVLVEDKIAPVCSPPAPLVITCEDLTDNFPANLTDALVADEAGTIALLNDLFGTARGIDNCGSVTVTQTVVDTRTTCGSGIIQRRFTVTDEEGLISQLPCNQQITVYAVNDYTITFPADAENQNCELPEADDLLIDNNGCSIFTVSTQLDTFQATAEECYKIRITYEVINWCEYNNESDAYVIPRDADNDNNFDEATYLHVVRGTVNDGQEDFALLDRDADQTNNNSIAALDLQDEATTGLPGIQEGSSVSNGYGRDGSRGFFSYQQFIKVYDDVAPVLVIESDSTGVPVFCDLDGDCIDAATLKFTVNDQCSPTATSATATLDAFINTGADTVYTLADFVADGGPVTIVRRIDPITSGEDYDAVVTDLPIGTHAIRIVANDGCGNTTVDFVIFTINDCKAPTPICISGLTATLMPTPDGGGVAAIWANDFIASPSEDCAGEVKFAIIRSADAASMGDDFVPGVNDTGLVLTCADRGLLAIRIYAVDPNGQADYCETTIFVQENQPGICEGGISGALAGSVTLPNHSPMSNVEINLTNGGETMNVTEMTSTSGSYVFTDLALGDDYTLQPGHNPSVSLARITTGDLILITRHILGLQPLEVNWQRLAADVTQDGNINVVDIIAIRRVILGLTNEFPATPSWRFYTAEGSEVINENNLNGTVAGLDFTSVEMGNVSDATENGYADDATGRSTEVLELENTCLTPGMTVMVNLRAASLLSGFQGTVELAEGIELINVTFSTGVDGGANLEQVADGLMSVSVMQTQSTQSGLNTSEASTGTKEVMTLELRANVAGQLSEFMVLNDRITTTEGYSSGSAATDLRLSFIEGVTTDLVSTAQFELMQNTPNPFSDETTIKFVVPETGDVSLVVRDVQGRVVLRRTLHAAVGINTATLKSESFNGATGVLTYTIVAGERTATKRMVLLH